MTYRKILSVVFAFILQIAPICKEIAMKMLPSGPAFAVIWRWAVGAVAYGGYHAVAGASVTITSSATAKGTNGVSFIYSTTTSEYFTDMRYTATPLPPGVSCGSTTGILSGTPTTNGVWNTTLTVSASGYPTITQPLAITIVDTNLLITTQPIDQIVSRGANATFSVSVSGTAPFSYQWKFNGANIANATASSYTLTNAQFANEGQYTVFISNSKATATSSAASLSTMLGSVFSDNFESGTMNNWTVTASPATAMANSTAQHHGTGSRSAIINNYLNKMYHNISRLDGHMRMVFWYYDAGDVGYAEARSYAGGSYTTNGTLNQLFALGAYNVSMDTTKYQCRVLTASPSSGWFNTTIARTAGWHKCVIERIANGTTINFYIDDVLGKSVTGATYYPIDDVMMGYVASGTSTASTGYIDDLRIEYMDAPTFTVQPTSKTVNQGQSVTFTTTATNNLQSYQWRLNGTNIGSATTSSYTIASSQTTDAGTYSVQAINGAGTTTSSSVTLTVNVPPSISTQPTNQAVIVGGTAVFSASVTGTSLYFQWQLNGSNLVNGTATTLSITNAQLSDAGTYSLIVSNTAGTVTSSNATLTVINPVSQIQNISITPGSGISFTLSGDSNSTFGVDVSTDLVNWTLLTNLTYTNGGFQFTDQIAADPTKFYRAHSP